MLIAILAVRTRNLSGRSKLFKIYELVARAARLSRGSHSQAKTRVGNISIYLLDVRSWRHPVWRQGAF